MIITIITLSVAVLLFASGKVRSDIVALSALLCLMLTGILTPEEALSGFSNPVVVMMVGLFVVGGAILQTGLAKRVSGSIMVLAGNNHNILFVLVMIVTSVVGAFVSNTGTIALMLPIVVSLAVKTGMQPGRLLMPLAFASSLGGMLTLIGTPPNLVIQETLVENGYDPLSFFSFTPIGVVCIVVGIAVMMVLARVFLSKVNKDDTMGRHKGKSLSQLVEEYNLSERISRFVISGTSPMCGKTVTDLDVYNRYGLTVMEVRRESSRQPTLLKSVVQKTAGPDTVLNEGDILYISGDRKQAERFAYEQCLDAYESLDDKERNGTLDFYDIGMAEIVIMPASGLVNRRVRESDFRTTYGINIIGIRRNGSYITDDIAHSQLRPGDVLLVHGAWSNIARLDADEDDFVVLGRPLEEAGRVTLDYKAPLAGFILLLMILSMVLDVIPIAPVTAVISAAVLMVIAGCFRGVDDAYKTIHWESIVLIASMMPMSIALNKTGVSEMVSNTLVGSLGNYGPYALLSGVYFTTSLLTLFVSNTATAVLMAPIALVAATQMQLSPYPFLFAVTLGASMCFASPFSTPPNALVMQAGRYSFMDYVKVGLPLQVIIGVVMLVLLPLLFPF